MDSTKAQDSEFRYFDHCRHHHSYEDLNLMHSYGEYLEAKHQQCLARKLRNTRVKMTVMQPNPNDHDNFLVFFHLQGFREFMELLGRASAVLICDERAAEKTTESAQAGWVAHLKTDEYILRGDHRGEILAFTTRPKDEGNPTRAKVMMNKAEGELGVHFVYLKLFFSDQNTSNKIETADALREDRTMDDPEAERLRTLFLGGNYQGDLVKDQTPSQAHFLKSYCRNLPYRLGILVGAFGSGKIRTIKTVAQAAKKIGKRILVVASGDPSAHQVVLILAQDKSLKVVRLHALGLEETTNSESFRNLAAAAEARAPWLSTEDDSANDWTPSSDDGEISYQLTKSLYQDRDQADTPDGSRRVLLGNAIWTKLLQYEGTIPGGPTTDLVTRSYLPEYYTDSQKQLLDKARKRAFNIIVETMAGLLVRDSDVTVCTIAQLGSL
ncbi:MAG: hypothetical protein L6R37_006608 [Teloschistes peruensis]|nr:MAG: hypothetical protein L6R37_006608 [Teloschistes peruensis]